MDITYQGSEMLLNSGSLLPKHKENPRRQVFPMANKRSSNSSMWTLNRLLALSVLGLLGAGLAMSQQAGDRQEITEQAIQDAYAKHDIRVRKSLPSYSGPPLLLDLFQKSLEDGTCDPQQHIEWEANFNAIMASRKLVDNGVSKLSEVTATTVTFIDTFGPIYSLPAKRYVAVVIAKPVAGSVCIPRSRQYVYTKLTLDILKQYKPAKRDRQQSQASAPITAVEFGGSVRFPSGYLETLLLSREGFIEIGKEYVLFMWKPVPSDDLLVISQAYLVQDGFVFPVSSNGDAQTYYTKSPFAEFEAQVEAAVAKNVDRKSTRL